MSKLITREVRMMDDTLTLKPLMEVYPDIDPKTIVVLDRFFYSRKCTPSKLAVDEIITNCEKGTK